MRGKSGSGQSEYYFRPQKLRGKSEFGGFIYRKDAGMACIRIPLFDSPEAALQAANQIIATLEQPANGRGNPPA